MSTPSAELLTAAGNGSRWRSRRWLFSLLGCLLLPPMAWLGFAAWRHLAPPSAASGWHYGILHQELPRVSALAMGPSKQLYVSLENRHGDGKVLLIAANGERSDLLAGLSKPDGMVVHRGGLVVTQEDGARPVIWWHGGEATELFEAIDVEGVTSLGKFVYVVEDRHGQGRLLRYDSDEGELTVLRQRLDEAEGVTVCPNGDLYYVEKGKETVRLMTADGTDPIVVSDLNQPGFVTCQPEGLWITEDATHGSRLLLLDQHSQLQVILNHLRAPQTLVSVGPGHYLLAEQGRDRILEIWKSTDQPEANI